MLGGALVGKPCRGRDFSQHLTGTDGYNLTETGNAATGTFGRVIAGTGTYDLQSQGGGITRVRPRGTYAFTWTESGNSTSGSLSLSQSGTDRYDLLEMFIDISNTSPSSRPGTLDFSPVGVTWVNPGFEDIVANPQILFGKSAEEVAKMLGEGWVKGKYGKTGEGWAFRKGDKIVYFEEGGVHVGKRWGITDSCAMKFKLCLT